MTALGVTAAGALAPARASAVLSTGARAGGPAVSTAGARRTAAPAAGRAALAPLQARGGARAARRAGRCAVRVAASADSAAHNAAAFQAAKDAPLGPGVRPLRVLIAGGGIGGLVLGIACLRKGMNVTVFERDASAIRGEGKYRGPIQIQSNALAALQAIDGGIASEVMADGCITVRARRHTAH